MTYRASKLASANSLVSLVAAMIIMLSSHALAAVKTIPLQGFASELQNLDVSFLARDLETGTDHVLEESDLGTRHSPLSTFKIPNLIIALEAGVAASPEAWRDWDPKRRPAEAHWPDEWKSGQTLEDAFRRSTVWYYRDVALEVGAQNYRDKLRAWRYGNAEVSDGSDKFWLDNTLKISLDEQVAFLSQVARGELPVSDQSLAALEGASEAAEANGVILDGKSGTGPDDLNNVDGRFSGWYVGYLRREGREPVVFALHVAAPSFSALREFRKAFAIKLLKKAGLAPEAL